LRGEERGYRDLECLSVPARITSYTQPVTHAAGVELSKRCKHTSLCHPAEQRVLRVHGAVAIAGGEWREELDDDRLLAPGAC
jgi:hypothetical protein